MANINIHIRRAPTAKVVGGGDSGYLALRIDTIGDEVTLFFQSMDELLTFEESVSTAVRALQQSAEVK